MTFPQKYIDLLFYRLNEKFGEAFEKKHLCKTIEEEKNEWRKYLEPYSKRPENIKIAIEICDKAPNLLEFMELLDGSALEKENQSLAVSGDGPPEWLGDHRDWARQIIYKKKIGGIVPMFSLNAAKDSLGLN